MSGLAPAVQGAWGAPCCSRIPKCLRRVAGDGSGLCSICCGSRARHRTPTALVQGCSPAPSCRHCIHSAAGCKQQCQPVAAACSLSGHASCQQLCCPSGCFSVLSPCRAGGRTQPTAGRGACMPAATACLVVVTLWPSVCSTLIPCHAGGLRMSVCAADHLLSLSASAASAAACPPAM